MGIFHPREEINFHGLEDGMVPNRETTPGLGILLFIDVHWIFTAYNGVSSQSH